MADTKIGALHVDLSLETVNFLNGLKDAQKEVDLLVKTVKPLSSTLKEAGEAMALVGDVIAASMVEAALHTAEYGAELKHLSERSGATTEDLSKLAFAAEQNGSSMEGLGTALKFLSKNMELALTGSKAQQDAFKALGVTAAELNATNGSSSKAFQLLAEKISAMEDPSQHAADLTKILGKNWVELVPTLKLGAEGLKQAGDEAERLGVVISGETAEADLKFEQTLKQVKTATEGLAVSIGDALIPQFTSMLGYVRDNIAALADFAKHHQGVTTVVFDTAAVVGTLGTAMVGIGIAIPPVLRSLSLLTDVLKAVGVSVSAAELGVVALGAAIGVGIGAFINYEIEGTKVRGVLNDVADAGFSMAAAFGLVKDKQTLVNEANKESNALIEKNVAFLHEHNIAYDQTGKSIAQVNAETTKLIQGYYNVVPTSKAAAEGTSADWAKSQKEQAEAAKKSRQDQSKANDDYFAGLTDFYKNQRQLGEISNDDLVADLLHFEDLRYEGTNKADGNLLALAADHEKRKQKIFEDGTVAQHSLDLIAQAQLTSDVKQAQADHEAALATVYKSDADFYQRMYSLGAVSANQLRTQQRNAENARYQDYIQSHGQSEAALATHNANLLKIDDDYFAHSLDLAHTYIGDSLLSEEELNKGRELLREVDSDTQAATYKEQHDALVIRAKGELEVWKQNSKEQGQLGHDVQHEWESAMDSMDKNVSKAFADMIVSGRLSFESLTSIAKNTATSILSAMLDGMIRPLTNELAKLGTSLTVSLLGLTQTKNPITGAVTGAIPGGGGLIGLFGGGGNPIPGQTPQGLANAGFTAGGTTTTGGETSAGLFGGAGAATAAAGIAAAATGIAGIIYSFLGTAHNEANDLVGNFQNPFNQQFMGLIGAVNDGAKAGTLTPDNLVYADNQAHSLWEQVLNAVDVWWHTPISTGFGIPAKISPDRQKVAGQFLDTELPFVNGWLGTLDQAAATGQFPAFKTGTPYVSNDGLAYLHQGEAVIPASQNPANRVYGAGGWNGGSAQSGEVHHYEMNVTVESGGVLDEMTYRDVIHPMWERMIENNSRGTTGRVTKTFKAHMGLAT